MTFRVLLLDLLCRGQAEGGADKGDDTFLGARHVVSTLRMKCLRKRCRAAPWNAVAMDLFKHMWASEVARSTPPSPRVFEKRRNTIPRASFTQSLRSKPSTCRCPSPATSEDHQHRLGDHTLV